MSDAPQIVQKKFELLVQATNNGTHTPADNNCICVYCLYLKELDRQQNRKRNIEESSSPPSIKKQFRLYHFLKSFDPLEFYSCRRWEASPRDLVRPGEDIEVLNKRGFGARRAVINRIRSYIQAELVPSSSNRIEKPVDRIIRNSLGLPKLNRPLGPESPTIVPPPIVEPPKV